MDRLGKQSTYTYLSYLIVLDSYRSSDDNQLSPIMNEKYHSPLNIETWSQKLAYYPDSDYVSYIMEGISTGFGVGFSRRCQLQPPLAIANILTKNTAVITEYLQQEIFLGRMQKHELPIKGYQVHTSLDYWYCLHPTVTLL